MGETFFGWGQRALQINMDVTEMFRGHMNGIHRSLHMAMDFCFCTLLSLLIQLLDAGTHGRPDKPGLDQFDSCFETRMGKSMDAIENQANMP